MEEAAHAAAMQAVHKAEKERRKGQEVQEWNARMSSLHEVQIALGGKSGTTTAAGRFSTAEEEKQEQGEAAGYVKQTGPSGGPDFLRELTRRGLLDRLGQGSYAHRPEDLFDGGESDVPVVFGFAENQNRPDDDPIGESGFGVLKGIKWHNRGFDGKTTSWRSFEMEFLMAMRHLRLDSVLSGDMEEIPVADRTISRDRLNAHYGNFEVAKYFAVWSLISSSLMTNADERVISSTKSPLAGWDRVSLLFIVQKPKEGAKLLLSKQLLVVAFGRVKRSCHRHRRDHRPACCIRRGGNTRAQRVYLAAFCGQPPPRLRVY